jgi:hypothetical protein
MKVIKVVATMATAVGSAFLPPSVFLGALLSGLFFVAIVLMAREHVVPRD